MGHTIVQLNDDPQLPLPAPPRALQGLRAGLVDQANANRKKLMSSTSRRRRSHSSSGSTWLMLTHSSKTQGVKLRVVVKDEEHVVEVVQGDDEDHSDVVALSLVLCLKAHPTRRRRSTLLNTN